MKFLGMKIKFQGLGISFTLFKVNIFLLFFHGCRQKTWDSWAKDKGLYFWKHSKHHEHHVDISFSCSPSHKGVIQSSPGRCGWVCAEAKNIDLEEATAFIANLLLSQSETLLHSSRLLQIQTWLIAQEKGNEVGILDTLSKNLQRCPQSLVDCLSQNHSVWVRLLVILVHWRDSINICWIKLIN